MNKKLSLSTLGDINGGLVGITANNAMLQALRDCEDRPALEGSRVVTLEIHFEPVMDPGGDLIGVTVSPIIKQPKLPAQKIPAQVLKVNVEHDIDGTVARVEAEFSDPYQMMIFDSENRSAKGDQH